MRRFLSAAATAAIPLLAAAMAAILLPATAQAGMCIGKTEGNRILAEIYGEHPVARGVSDGRLVMLYASPDRETWTVAVVDPGIDAICIIAAGDSWEAVDLPVPGRAS